MKPGQFLIRRKQYQGWGIARFLRLGNPYSAACPNLFYCQAWGMQGEGGEWVWGPFDEAPRQITLTMLYKHYEPASEAAAAEAAEAEVERQYAIWNARYPDYASAPVIRRFGVKRP